MQASYSNREQLSSSTIFFTPIFARGHLCSDRAQLQLIPNIYPASGLTSATRSGPRIIPTVDVSAAEADRRRCVFRTPRSLQTRGEFLSSPFPTSGHERCGFFAGEFFVLPCHFADGSA